MFSRRLTATLRHRGKSTYEGGTKEYIARAGKRQGLTPGISSQLNIHLHL